VLLALADSDLQRQYGLLLLLSEHNLSLMELLQIDRGVGRSESGEVGRKRGR